LHLYDAAAPAASLHHIYINIAYNCLQTTLIYARWWKIWRTSQTSGVDKMSIVSMSSQDGCKWWALSDWYIVFVGNTLIGHALVHLVSAQKLSIVTLKYCSKVFNASIVDKGFVRQNSITLTLIVLETRLYTFCKQCRPRSEDS